MSTKDDDLLKELELEEYKYGFYDRHRDGNCAKRA
jgi:hypothetical protein